MPDVVIARRGALAATALCSCGVTLGAAGCGRAEGALEGRAEGATVVVAMNVESEPAAGFDPLVAWGCGEHVHEPLVQSTLVLTDGDMNITGDLATDYSCSDDGLVWTFCIRDDAVFTDGVPLTAEDVAFTVNAVAAGGVSEADLSMVREAVAIDDRRVDIHLTRPHNALLYTLAVLGIVPAHAYGEGYGRAPIGSGRYMLEQWDRGQQVVFVANPNYYGPAPLMTRVVVAFMTEEAALAAVKAGEVDVAFTSPSLSGADVPGYRLEKIRTVDSRGISLPCAPAGGVRLVEGDMAFDAGNDVTCDVALRRAMNLAIDREAVVEHVLRGYGSAAYSVGDGMPWSSGDMRVDHDPARAGGILDDAGWDLGADGVRSRDGLRASVELWYSVDDSSRQAMAHEFARQMAKIGIEVVPKGGSWDEVYLHQFCDPVLWGWGSNAPIEVYELHHSAGWGNYPGYENDVVDGYLEAALAQSNLEASWPYWRKAMWDGTDGVAPKGASTWVWMANIDHLYWKRDGLEIGRQKLQPHGHGWSVLNNVDRWMWA